MSMNKQVEARRGKLSIHCIIMMIIITGIVWIIISNTVNAAANPYTGGNANCTWTAWQMAKDNTGVELPWRDDAGNWASQARNHNFTVSDTPRAKSIAVYAGNPGHVAYVADYNSGKNQIYVKEGGFKGGYHEGWTPLQPSYNGKLLGFVYLGSTQPSNPQGHPIGGGAQLVSDGDYHIVSGLDHSKGIDVYGASTTNGTNIQLYGNISDDTQVFTVKYLGDGFYSIRHKSSGKSLDVTGAALDYGTNLELYDYNGTDAQKWVIRQSNDAKYFNIMSKCNGLSIDVDNCQTANGTNIKMWESADSAAQKWKFIACGSWDSQTIKNGRYEIVSAINNNKCMDIEQLSTENGGNVHLWSKVGAANQVFDVRYIGKGYYEIKDMNSGKLIELVGNYSLPGTNLNIYNSNGTDAQKWIIRHSSGSYYNIICKGSGLYIDADGAKDADGTNIKGWVKNGSNAQKWKFVPETHKWGKGSVVKEPSCEYDGIKSYKCLICGETKQEYISCNGHRWGMWTTIKKASATETGLTERKCSVCGKKEQEVIPNITGGSNSIQLAVEEQEKKIITQKGDGDPQGSKYGVLCAHVKKSSKTSNTLTWNKVNGASGYIIYGNFCGTKYRYVKIAEIKGTSYIHKKLKKGTYYKYLVVAYKNAAGIKTVIAASKTMHAATTGGKVGNYKKVKVNKKTVQLKKGKTFKIKAKAKPASKKLKVKKHRGLCYESSNPSIATVSGSGKVKAKKKGYCIIYVYSQSGTFAKVKIKVK